MIDTYYMLVYVCVQAHIVAELLKGCPQAGSLEVGCLEMNTDQQASVLASALATAIWQVRRMTVVTHNTRGKI